MKMKVGVIGNIVADFIAANIDRVPNWGELKDIKNPIGLNIGGNGAIASVCMAKLGLTPVPLGKIGEDEIGNILFKKLKNEGVKPDYILKEPSCATSATVAIVNNSGERIFFHHYGCNEKLKKKDIEAFQIDNLSALLLCSIFILPGISVDSMISILKRARKHKIPTFMDVAYDPSGKWNLKGVYEYVDFFLPNELEIKKLANSQTLSKAVKQLHKRGANTIIVKQGKNGASIFQKDSRSTRISAPSVEVIDSTGAGDAFNASFIYKYLNSRDIYSSTKFAVYSASLTVTRIGGSSAAPEVDEVERLMRKRS